MCHAENSVILEEIREAPVFLDTQHQRGAQGVSATYRGGYLLRAWFFCDRSFKSTGLYIIGPWMRAKDCRESRLELVFVFLARKNSNASFAGERILSLRGLARILLEKYLGRYTKFSVEFKMGMPRSLDNLNFPPLISLIDRIMIVSILNYFKLLKTSKYTHFISCKSSF